MDQCVWINVQMYEKSCCAEVDIMWSYGSDDLWRNPMKGSWSQTLFSFSSATNDIIKHTGHERPSDCDIIWPETPSNWPWALRATFAAETCKTLKCPDVTAPVKYPFTFHISALWGLWPERGVKGVMVFSWVQMYHFTQPCPTVWPEMVNYRIFPYYVSRQ